MHSEAATDSGKTPPRILVVEDEPVIRFVIAEALRDQGVAVIEASTADEAWLYLQNDPLVAVVFTDHRMPGTLQGADLAVRIADALPEIDVVLTSGDFAGAGYRGTVLRKPYDVVAVAADLARKVNSKKRGSGT